MQVYRPHPRSAESESPGLGIWIFTNSLGDCDVHHLIAGVILSLYAAVEIEIGDPQMGTWKGNGNFQAICLGV